MLKVLYVFYRTLYYLCISYLPKADVLALKKQWADEQLKFFGIELEIKGSPIADEPVILLGNHISFLDIIALMASHPRVVFLAKKEVGGWPVIGPTARRVGTLFVDRDLKDKARVRKQISDELLRTRSHLVVFPSGTTTLDEELPWKKGMFEIAQEYSIPIQTFAVTYSHKRLCSYIDDDNMLLKIRELFRTQGKKVCVEWLSAFKVAPLEDSAIAAERARQHVIPYLHN